MAHIKNKTLKKKEKKKSFAAKTPCSQCRGVTERSHMQQQRSKILCAAARTSAAKETTK